jgi:hypothetical protein
MLLPEVISLEDSECVDTTEADLAAAVPALRGSGDMQIDSFDVQLAATYADRHGRLRYSARS